MRRLVLLLAFAAACNNGPTPSDDTAVEDTDTVQVPSFKRVTAQVLKPSCAYSFCHGGSRPEGDLSLTGDADHDYLQLVNVASSVLVNETLVIPGDPDNSYLIKKLEGAPGIDGDLMPSGVQLSPSKIQLVRDWISEGALREPAEEVSAIP